MSYFKEFRVNWQSLLATLLGIATGSAIGHYTLSMFGPELIEEFGWSRSEYALVGTLQIITALATPFAGRFADRFGVRISLIIGFIVMSLGFLAFSVMTGSLSLFFGIWVVQHIFGVLTTSLVFARGIVERFNSARGTALSVMMVGPPLSGAIMAPILGSVMEADGWRAGFVLLAVISAVGGLICVSFIRGAKRAPTASAKSEEELKLTRSEFFSLIRHPTFLLLVGGMALINIPQVFASSQLKLIVLSTGITDQAATWMVSLYATGVIIGRCIFGVVLDRVPAHYVALFALSLPAVGFVIIASPQAATTLIAGGVLLVGIAQGAEGDIGAYMISRHFNLKNFSLIFGFVKAGLDTGGAIGSVILSYSLHTANDSYVPFLLVAAVATIAGAIAFFLTGAGKNQAAPRPKEKIVEPVA